MGVQRENIKENHGSASGKAAVEAGGISHLVCDPVIITQAKLSLKPIEV